MIEYLIKILLDGKEAESEANRAGRSLSGLDQTVMRVGKSMLSMFALDRIKESVLGTIEWADAMNDAAKKVGITSERMQLFNLAAKSTGTDIGNITQSLKFLAQNMAESDSKPTGEAAMAFARLKVSMDQVKGLRPDELFLALSERMRLMPDSVQKTADMISLLGRGAQDLFPAMKEGFAGATQKAKELGAVVGEQDMEALEALKKKMGVIVGQSQAALAKTVAKAAPFAQSALDIYSSALAYNAKGEAGEPMGSSESNGLLQRLLVSRSIGARAKAFVTSDMNPLRPQEPVQSTKDEAAARAVELQKLTVEELKGLRQDVKQAL